MTIDLVALVPAVELTLQRWRRGGAASLAGVVVVVVGVVVHSNGGRGLREAKAEAAKALKGGESRIFFRQTMP